MKKIYKYSIDLTQFKDEYVFDIPSGATFIHVDREPGRDANGSYEQIRVWALVETTMPTEKRRLTIKGTGHPIEDNLVYVDSVVLVPFAWHVFEVK